MEKNNNGKIAIAIVAMFVVALSIVGITYAYFTASVTPNTTAKSVEVTAGVLKVKYTAGDSINTTGKTIVPGWKSDGKQVYYAPAITDGQIHSVSVDTITDEDDKTAYSANVVHPLTFSVQDQSSTGATAYYAIKLTNITNGIAAANENDAENVKVTLVSGTWDKATATGTPATLSGVTLATDLQMAATGGNNVLSTPIAITGGTTHNFYLIVEYADSDADDQNASQQATLAATVEVVGLNYVDTDNDKTPDTYKDINGQTYSTTTVQ